MANLIVSGLPYQLTLNNMMYDLSQMLTSYGLSDYWFRALENIRGTNFQQTTIEFQRHFDAKVAMEYLHSMNYIFNGHEYLLVAEIEKTDITAEYSHPYEEHLGYRSEEPYSRMRSPAMPRLGDEAHTLDMEIELLKKRRMIIEEEQRLLMAKKKFEIMKEYGSRSANQFMMRGKNENWRDRERSGNGLRERVGYGERERVQGFKSQDRAHKSYPYIKPNASEWKKNSLFKGPCAMIVLSMKNVLQKYQKERPLLVAALRETLRSRLTVALRNRSYMPTSEVVELYRKLYPESMDESLVRNMLARLEKTAKRVKKQGGKKGGEGKSDVKVEAEIEEGGGDELLKEDGVILLDSTEGENKGTYDDWEEGGVNWADM